MSLLISSLGMSVFSAHGEDDPTTVGRQRRSSGWALVSPKPGLQGEGRPASIIFAWTWESLIKERRQVQDPGKGTGDEVGWVVRWARGRGSP